MAFVDFAALKERVSIEQTATLLGLNTKPTGSQLRAACPSCKEGGDRAIVITPAKGLFYCFPGKKGGDQIELVCHVKGVSQKDAAVLMSGEKIQGTSSVQNSSVPVPQNEKGQLKPLDYLQPTHESVQALGISAETATVWESGFASKGMMRGRYAVPIKSKDGELLGYVGIAVQPEQTPRFLLPNNLDPQNLIFAQDKVEPGTLFLVRNPLEVLLASENGAGNVVSFFADITPQNLETLAALCDQKRCDSIELF
jgi:hypothetical protein